MAATVQASVRELLEQTIATMDVLLQASDRELPLPSSHVSVLSSRAVNCGDCPPPAASNSSTKVAEGQSGAEETNVPWLAGGPSWRAVVSVMDDAGEAWARGVPRVVSSSARLVLNSASANT